MGLASVALLLFSVAASACAQLLLRHGMQRAAAEATRHGGPVVHRAATSPWVLLGLACFGVAAVTWMATLARVPLSLAYPFNALGYLAILVAGSLVLHERTSAWTWVGSVFVVVGLLAVVWGQPR